jgi:hypothetical protein
MNTLKDKILKATADLLLGRQARPSNGNLSNVKGLEQCVAFVLETKEGLKPIHVIGCRLKSEEREIYPEVVWDLICARVITPVNEGNGLNEIRLHTDAEANWKKFKATAAAGFVRAA